MKFKQLLLILSVSIGFIQCKDDNSDTENTDDACYFVQDINKTYSTYYKPEDSWLGDPMPYFENNTFYIFYLNDARDGATTYHPWHLATTTDFVTYTDKGEMIPCGTSSEQDGALGTGSVFKYNNVYYAFYTGHNESLDPDEKILLATSTDLIDWKKDTGFELRASDGCDRDNFRDPYVYQDASGDFKMLISSRADFGDDWNGAILEYTSENLTDWSFESIFYKVEDDFMAECPDVFIEGDYQYLVYSGYDDRLVHYRYRKNGDTEWIIPANETLDGIAYYAAKTASNGQERYLMGWCPTRDDNDDYSDFSWAGSLIVHRLISNDDGSLAVAVPQSISKSVADSIDLNCFSENNVENDANTFTLDATTEEAYAVFEREIGTYKITTTITPAASTCLGFAFGACGERDETFKLIFDLTKKELRLDDVTSDSSENITSVSLPVAENNRYDVSIVIENSICVAYVNDETVLTNRIYKMNNNPWSVFAENGKVIFSDLKLYR